MSMRALFLLILIVPALLVGGAAVMGLRIPVPTWGRDYVVRVPLTGPGFALDLPEIAGPDDPARPLVVIDAGHGGRDPGAIGTDAEGRAVREKDITLAIALALRDALVEGGGIRVALTRADDRILPLADRPEIARQLEADLFLSIHADSAGEREAVRAQASTRFPTRHRARRRRALPRARTAPTGSTASPSRAPARRSARSSSSSRSSAPRNRRPSLPR